MKRVIGTDNEDFSRNRDKAILQYFSSSRSRTDIMLFLLKHGHSYENFIRLGRLVECLGFNKTTIYNSIRQLNGKGWLIFHLQGCNTWLGHQQLPQENLNRIRTALAKAKGFDSWFDLMVSNRGNKLTNRTRTTLNRRSPRKVGSQRRSDEALNGYNKLDSAKSKAPRFPRAEELMRENQSSEPDIQDLTTERFDRLMPGVKKQRRHRFDPQGFPLMGERSRGSEISFEKHNHTHK